MHSQLTRRRTLFASFAAGFAQPPASTLEKLLAIPTPRHQVVIDTDTYNEIDDQYAVAYALLSPEHMQVEALYAAPFLNDRSKSAGDGMEQSYQEIQRILKLMGRRHEGFAFRGSDSFFAAAGKPVESAAARDLVAKAIKPRSKPLYVLTVGAPTNVSSALLMEPAIKDKIVVVWLGGTTHEWPSAREFNLQQDIHASRILFDSGVPLVQIPTKNVSEHLRTTLPELERYMKGQSTLGDYFYEQFVNYHKHATAKRPPDFPWSKVIWDISTVAWMIDPRWVPSKLVASPVLNDDFTWGSRPGRHPVRVATNALRDEVFFDLFAKLRKSGPK